LSLLSSCAFDAAVMDIFAALLSGAALLPFDVRREGVAGLGPFLVEGGVSVYHSTPTLFRALAEGLRDAVPSVRLVVLGGEEATRRDVELFRRHFPPASVFVNGFGPSESTLALQYFVDATSPLIRDAVPVGYPVAGMQVLLVDEGGDRTFPFGEIAIRSPCVSLGYWGQPDLTAAAFVPDPEGNGERLHRTGDLGRLLPDGSIEFVGRSDRQIKVRGFRVDPSEVESALGGHAGVAQCVVLARRSPSANRLLAYVVPRGHASLRIPELRRFLAQRVPDYMVPSAWVILDELPLAANGKLDRHRLPEPEGPGEASRVDHVAPRTPLESQLAVIWADVLGVTQIGVEDDFLTLGGHSLTATQILSRIRDRFGLELPFPTLFETSTIAGLAERLLEASLRPE
jgi:acyl-coenzyme A synthetase/AMP-(fatty) acid ligase/acyl carrier protein